MIGIKLSPYEPLYEEDHYDTARLYHIHLMFKDQTDENQLNSCWAFKYLTLNSNVKNILNSIIDKTYKWEQGYLAMQDGQIYGMGESSSLAYDQFIYFNPSHSQHDFISFLEHLLIITSKAITYVENLNNHRENYALVRHLTFMMEDFV